MPIYTCTTAESTLSGPIKAALAGEIGAIHSEINHVPSTYVNVVFQSSPASFAVEGGRVFAEPGHEQAWIAGS